MHDPRHFIRFFEIHQWICANHLKEITDEESRRTPEAGGNSLNWVLGHIVASRNDILALLHEPPTWSEVEAASYVRGSDGRSTAFRPHSMAELLDALDRSLKAIRDKLTKITPEDLQAATEKGTVGSDLAFLQFHESYHMGQIGYLCRLLGREGIIR